MDILLSADEVRVIGALIEKEITTPEYYPLSLNALTNACNQKSNRFPTVSWSDEDVARIVEALREKHLVSVVTGATGSVSRVPKYRQQFAIAVGLDEKDKAVMCELMVRGPQTAAQLRGHTERLCKFEDLAAVDATLQGLMARQPPLVALLPRQPGHKEQRYGHVLSGAPAAAAPEDAGPPPEAATLRVRAEKEQADKLRADLDALKAQVEQLRKEFDELKNQLV